MNNKKNKFNYMTERNIIEPIGFLIQGKELIVANPCRIPIEFLEDALKQHKKRKTNETEVSVFSLIQLPFPFKKLKGGKNNGFTRKSRRSRRSD